jgi:glycosyltransferase involved in cell wall biosynthesis
MRERVSVIIITKNNAHEIGACLESVTWADEIVVLDSFSTDGTEEICRRYGAQFHQHPFDGYSSQLNRCLALATGEWILRVDADEVVSARLRDQILEVAAGKGEACAGYEFPRHQYLHRKLIKHSGFYPQPHLRFFRRDCGRFISREPHQRVKVNGRVGRLDGPVAHHCWVSNGEIFNSFMEYAKIEAHWAHAHGERVHWWDFLKLVADFGRRYLLRGGIFHGTFGLIMSLRTSASRYLKYTLMWELQNQEKLERG